MESTDLLNPFEVNSQIPLDGKTFKPSLSELKNLGRNNKRAYKYFEGLVVYCNEDKNRYEWREVGEDEEGLLGLEGQFTYPQNAISNGVDYSGRTFDFFIVDKVLSVNGRKGDVEVVEDKNYVHVQFQSSDRWEFEHPLKKKVSIICFDTAGTEANGRIALNDGKKVIIEWNYPFSGEAVCN